jgi:hypothetical protein
MDKTYVETVRLLLEAAPVIFETPSLAMKGGTAINLFVEDIRAASPTRAWRWDAALTPPRSGG